MALHDHPSNDSGAIDNGNFTNVTRYFFRILQVREKMVTLGV